MYDPLLELQHYGVKGMKWDQSKRKRKVFDSNFRGKGFPSEYDQAIREADKAYKEAKEAISDNKRNNALAWTYIRSIEGNSAQKRGAKLIRSLLETDYKKEFTSPFRTVIKKRSSSVKRSIKRK